MLENYAINLLNKSILLINQVHHHLHHYILLLGLALGDHQGQCDQGVIGNTLAAVLAVEDAVVVEEPKEQGGRNAFVALSWPIDETAHRVGF